MSTIRTIRLQFLVLHWVLQLSSQITQSGELLPVRGQMSEPHGDPDVLVSERFLDCSDIHDSHPIGTLLDYCSFFQKGIRELEPQTSRHPFINGQFWFWVNFDRYL